MGARQVWSCFLECREKPSKGHCKIMSQMKFLILLFDFLDAGYVAVFGLIGGGRGIEVGGFLALSAGESQPNMQGCPPLPLWQGCW